MSFDLRIPEFDTDCKPRPRYRSERRCGCQNRDDPEDPINRLPGQMMNIAGAAVIGSMGIGLMGMMLKK
jgi:hypothetical protein